jgi:hypothetical protein
LGFLRSGGGQKFFISIAIGIAFCSYLHFQYFIPIVIGKAAIPGGRFSNSIITQGQWALGASGGLIFCKIKVNYN